MLSIKLKRFAKKSSYTIGHFIIQDKVICDSIEDRDRGLSNNMSLEDVKAIKVYGETAIPVGTYKITLGASSKFKNRPWCKRYDGLVPIINNVRGFSGVLIHPLNTAEDSLGCIGPGYNTVKGKVTNSTGAYYILMDNYILPAIKNNEEVYLTIE